MLRIKVYRYNYASESYEPIGYYKRVDTLDENPVLVCRDIEDARTFRNINQVRRVLTTLYLKFNDHSYDIEDVNDDASYETI